MIPLDRVGHVLCPSTVGEVYLAMLETVRGPRTLTGTSLFRFRAELRGYVCAAERPRLLRPSVVADVVRPTAEQLQVLARAHTAYYHLRLRTVVAEKVRLVWDSTGQLPVGFEVTDRVPSLTLTGRGRTVLELPDLRRVMWLGERSFLETFDGTPVGHTPTAKSAGIPEARVAKADLAVFPTAPDDLLPLEARAAGMHPRFSKELPLYYLRTREEPPAVDAEFEALLARAPRRTHPPENNLPPIPVPGLPEALDFFSRRKPSR